MVVLARSKVQGVSRLNRKFPCGDKRLQWKPLECAVTWKLITMLAFFAACLAAPASACLKLDKKPAAKPRKELRLSCIWQPPPDKTRETAKQKAA